MIRVSYPYEGGYEVDVYPDADRWEFDDDGRLHLFVTTVDEAGLSEVRIASYHPHHYADVHVAGQESDDPERVPDTAPVTTPVSPLWTIDQ